MNESYKTDNDLDEKINEISKKALKKCQTLFETTDDICQFNQEKVLHAMQKNKLAESHFGYTTGYGYNDAGRDVLEAIYADVFKTEDALVRSQLVSGTSGLAVTLSAILKHGDELVYISGTPYDTLLGVIGVRETTGSLIENGVKYSEVALKNDTFDIEEIKNKVTKNTKVVAIQRSRGYSTRKALSIAEISEAIKVVKEISEDIIIMVDNCYGEFVEKLEPTEVGASLAVGSLIKNIGGGLAPLGAYVVGESKLIERVASRLTAPGLAKEVGASMGVTRTFAQGLFLAPSVARNALKTAMFASSIFEDLGFTTYPKYNDTRSDIVQAIEFNDEKLLISFCQSIQYSSPVDSFVTAMPWAMPGYDNDIIMASGSFVSGSSIELSADAPIKPPYIAYFQGGLTFEHGVYAIKNVVRRMYADNLLTLK